MERHPALMIAAANRDVGGWRLGAGTFDGRDTRDASRRFGFSEIS